MFPGFSSDMYGSSAMAGGSGAAGGSVGSALGGMAGPIGMAAGGLAGGLGGLLGAGTAARAAERSYQHQFEMMDKGNRFARENRDWQKMMSDTSYQRATQDLRAAGLNPMLAIKGGASTPAGGQGGSAGSAAVGNQGEVTSRAFQTMVNSALDVMDKRVKKQVGEAEAELKGVQRGLVEAQTHTASSTTDKIKQETKIKTVELAVQRALKNKVISAKSSSYDWEKLQNEIMQKNPHLYMNKKEIAEIVKMFLGGLGIATGVAAGNYKMKKTMKGPIGF